MTDVTPFMFEAQAVRVVMRDDEPWFVAADVCAALGIHNNRDAVTKLDSDEVVTVGLTDSQAGRGPQSLTIVSESGLYTLALRCREATTPGTVPHRFKRWVTREVLPSLRRTGGYQMGEAAADGAPDWQIDRSAEREIRLAVDLVREARLLHGRAVAKALWHRLPLPPVLEPDLAAGVPQAPQTPVSQFMAEACWRQATATISAADLFAAYESWRRAADLPALSIKAFGMQMRAQPGIIGIKNAKGCVVYRGLALR